LPLKIGRGDVGHIHDHAKESYPEECAGAIVGMDTGEMKVVVDVWRAENSYDEIERSRRFLIEPLQIKDFEERAQERDMDLLGFYHSHPDHPAEPSEYDRENAWPYYSYVIASVNGENIEEMRSWVLKDDRSGYDEEPIVG
jgi:proteasome lid subunit RPN8/RPN11